MPQRRSCPAFLVTLLLVVLAPLSALAAVAPITMEVDAREAPLKLLHTRLVIPVTPGPLTLYYPKWIPGEHGPNGPVQSIAGLRINAGKQTLSWQCAWQADRRHRHR